MGLTGPRGLGGYRSPPPGCSGGPSSGGDGNARRNPQCQPGTQSPPHQGLTWPTPAGCRCQQTLAVRGEVGRRYCPLADLGQSAGLRETALVRPVRGAAWQRCEGGFESGPEVPEHVPQPWTPPPAPPPHPRAVLDPDTVSADRLARRRLCQPHCGALGRPDRRGPFKAAFEGTDAGRASGTEMAALEKRRPISKNSPSALSGDASLCLPQSVSGCKARRLPLVLESEAPEHLSPPPTRARL